MNIDEKGLVEWNPSHMIEIFLSEPDDFLKVRETLTRIGVASRKEKKIYQSCHILHKQGRYFIVHFKELFALDGKHCNITLNDIQQGRYFIVHFKELFALDGKHCNITLNDIQRRNRIAKLLSDWNLIKIEDEQKILDVAPLNQIKVLAYKEKGDWILEQKYNIGGKRN